jgi:RNA polymerase sigma-70 factor (ECF subfamily)
VTGADERVARREHVVVTCDAAIGEPYAEAIARTVEAARAAAVARYGFAMPEVIKVKVDVDPGGHGRLFNDGLDTLTLSVRSEADLRRPGASGFHHLYGLCHEVGHLAMYRPIADRGWMTTAAAEGWAHYLGSRLVDDVFDREGPGLWPDRYPYRDDGTARLDRQLAAGAGDDPAARGAGLWRELVAVVGDKGVAPVFAAWARATVDPADPARALRRALQASNPDPRVLAWWGRAEAELVVKRPRSAAAAHTVAPEALKGETRELARDDGKPAGKASIAGGGHAVRFEAPGGDWYLTAVRVHGSRYGSPRPPDEDFQVYLCDEDFKQIAAFPFPYATFERGPPKWYTLEVKPTKVPARFIVCVAFNPTQRKGVFVSRSGAAGAHSLVGLPGAPGRPLAQGEWMIRARVRQPR